MKDLLEVITKNLVDYPEKVEVHGTVINFKGNEEEFYDNKRKPKNRHSDILC